MNNMSWLALNSSKEVNAHFNLFFKLWLRTLKDIVAGNCLFKVYGGYLKAYGNAERGKEKGKKKLGAAFSEKLAKTESKTNLETDQKRKSDDFIHWRAFACC